MLRLIASFLLGMAVTTTAMAQTTGPLGGFKHDRTAPIEITADSVEVRQAENLAIFTGNVVAGQGTLRLTASRMEVIFDQDNQSDSDTGAIKNVKAQGSVFLSNGAETAQGDQGEYNLETGMVTMTGDVILTQGENAGSGKSLQINLNTGVAKMGGRVQLIFQPKDASTGATSN